MRALALLVTVAAALAPSAFSQSPQEVIKSERTQLVTLVRVINTAENKYKNAVGRYGGLADLQRAHLLDASVFRSNYPFAYGYTESTADAMSLLPETASFALIVSAQGASYSVAVKNRADPDNFGVFSDQTGLIYTGQPLQ